MSARPALLLAGILGVLALAGPAVDNAAANPVWFVGETELPGSETATVIGDAVLGRITVAGVGVTCKKAHYEMTVYNTSFGMVDGFKALDFSTCVASEECVVKWARGAKLSWNGHLATSGGGDYVVFLKAGLEIYFESGGPGCPLNNTLVPIKGSAGALYDNPTETFSFSIAAFGATSTKLTDPLGSLVEWDATFTTEIVGSHAGQPLTVG